MKGKSSKKIKQTESDKFLQNLTEEQEKLGARIFDLVMGRVLKRAYLSLNEETRKDMEAIFLSDDDNAQGNFIKQNIPDFKKMFKEESKKIEVEIKTEIEKQFT